MIWWITCQQHNMYHRLTVILYREHAQHGLHDLVDHLSTTQYVSQTHSYIEQREHAQHGLHDLVDHLSTTQHVSQTHSYTVQRTCSAQPSQSGGSPVNNTTCITDSVILYRENMLSTAFMIWWITCQQHNMYDSQLYCTENTLSTAFTIWWITCQQHNMYHRLMVILYRENTLSTAFMIWWITCQQHNMYHRLTVILYREHAQHSLHDLVDHLSTTQHVSQTHGYIVQRTRSAQPSRSGGSPVNNTTCITDSQLYCTENTLSTAFMIWWITCQQHMYHRLTVILYREHAQHGLHDLVDHLSTTQHVSQTHGYIVLKIYALQTFWVMSSLCWGNGHLCY